MEQEPALEQNLNSETSGLQDVAKPLEDERHANLTRRMHDIVSSIFSRCGVPKANFRISELLEFSASVTYVMNWKFKCRCSDKPLHSVSDETHVMSMSALDEFTLANTKELEKDSAKTKDFIKHISEAKFELLNSLAGQIVCFNRINAIGKTRCKNCHGSGTVACEECNGKGRVVCPACGGMDNSCTVCHGEGRVRCSRCSGSGKAKCHECNGKGEHTVDREIIYDASCTKDISLSLKVPGSDKPITSFSKEDEKAIISAAEFSDASSGNETPKGYCVTFAGTAPCYAVHVTLEGVSKPFDFIICGKTNLYSICKPPVLDYVFAEESNLLADTLYSSTDDVNEKIKCVKVLSSKAILAKTIRTIENHELEIAKEQAVKQGVTVDSLINSQAKKESSKLNYIRSKVKQELLDKITDVLSENAHGYVSDDFARNFAKNLIAFIPMLMVLNPNSKMIWAGITLATWMVSVLISYFSPNIFGIIIVMSFSALICAFTSVSLTKNWTYYSAVSLLKLTHRFKKVPSLTAEAVHSIRLIVGSFFIALIVIGIITTSAN
ncbi:MAG: hypothetical protein ACI4ND_06370 [Succinivibrio sp.]